MTETIATPRLDLRPLANDAAGALHAIFGDPRAMLWWDTPALPDRAATAAMVARFVAVMARGSHAYWTAHWRGDTAPDAAPLGVFDLSDIVPPAAEVGFIVAPAWWRQGVAREAMAAVMTHGARSLGLTCFTARYHAGNEASAALLARLGFGPPRRLSGAVQRAGETRDCLCCERRV